MVRTRSLIKVRIQRCILGPKDNHGQPGGFFVCSDLLSDCFVDDSSSLLLDILTQIGPNL